ncbi:MAG: MFS transporter [Firmicutes bacterium]|nr:MFS transporter [Bacillota bacterium]
MRLAGIKTSAPEIYLILSFVMQLANSIMFTTYAIYYIKVLGLNPLQLVLVGTVLEVAVLLFEVPTGVVADTFGRRLSVILGVFILGGAFVMEGSIPLVARTLLRGGISLFGALLLAETIRGIGETFISGAGDAWIAEEVREDAVGGVFLRANQASLFASIAGIAASVGLASISLNLPYIAGGGLYLFLGLFLLVSMPETNFRPSHEERAGWRAIFGTLQDGLEAVRVKPVLLLALVAGLFSGAASEGFDRLWEAHFLQNIRLPRFGNFNPVVWFGVINIGANLLGLLAAGIARRRLDASGYRNVTRLLMITSTLSILGMISLGLAGNFAWAIASFWAIGAVNAVKGPFYRTWLNQNIEGRTRATILSMMSQADALGQTALGPAVGAVGARYSLRTAMVMAAFLLSPTLEVFRRAFKESRTSSKPDVQPARTGETKGY